MGGELASVDAELGGYFISADDEGDDLVPGCGEELSFEGVGLGEEVVGITVDELAFL